jgi:hypothetical protein
MTKLVMMKKLFVAFIVLLGFIKAATAQNVVSGTVYDSDGKSGLSGTYVSVKGHASIGTTADMNGKYIIRNVPDDTVLVFRFIGYKTQEIAVGTRSVIDVTMEQNVEQISESVVTAMGITREQIGRASCRERVLKTV